MTKTDDASQALFDAAPFAEKTVTEPLVREFVWTDPRDIERVTVEWAIDQPDSSGIHVEYWHSTWPEHRIGGAGAGWSGWGHEGDWYNGEWLTADTRLDVSGPIWKWTFAPLNEREFTDESCADFPATFRRTLKLRIVAQDPLPAISSLRVETASAMVRRHVSVVWEKSASTPIMANDVEVFNGAMESFSTDECRVVLDLLIPESDRIDSHDRAIVTIRGGASPFSFAVEDIDDGPLVIPDFGVAVADGTDHVSYEALSEQTAGRSANLYQRVFDEPEQTFERAWNEQPAKKPFYMVLGVEGRRHRFKVHPDGSLERDSGPYIKTAPGADTKRFSEDTGRLRWSFSLPRSPYTSRFRKSGYLPILTTVWEYGGLAYEQTAFATLLGRSLDATPIRGDDTVVAFVRLVVTNAGPSQRSYRVALGTALNEEAEALTLDPRGTARTNDGRTRAIVLSAGQSMSSEYGIIRFTGAVEPQQREVIDLVLPQFALTEDEVSAVERLSFDSAHDEVASYWSQRVDRGTKLSTGVPLLDDYWRAHLTHLLINHERHPATQESEQPCDVGRVGSFGYGSYANESVMQVSELDRRGYHVEAERGYELYLTYQGTLGLKGDFATSDGVLNGAGGYECLSYNQNHGWVLWSLAEHYRLTRDAAWIDRVAEHVVAACDWIVRERRRTMTSGDCDAKAVEYGFLPAGELEDIRDYRHWLSTNVYTWWGFDAASRVLKDIGHPDGERLCAEADAMANDLIAGFTEARIRTPVVRLSDGTAVPHVPSHQHLRGRSYGWIRETLEGAIHLIRCNLFDPSSDLGRWILSDYEDNLYLSNEFGYTVRDREGQWFSRGGFSMQPNLLCGPLPYLYRDEIAHYVRASLNAIAVGLHADTRMMTEHPLPELGDFAGDHFKTSDESNAAYWLRSMFLYESGDELRLGWGIPRSWFRDDVTIGIENAATHFGPASVQFTAKERCSRFEVDIEPPRRDPPARILLRIRHPFKSVMQSVTVGGETWNGISASDEYVILPELTRSTRVIVTYNG